MHEMFGKFQSNGCNAMGAVHGAFGGVATAAANVCPKN